MQLANIKSLLVFTFPNDLTHAYFRILSHYAFTLQNL